MRWFDLDGSSDVVGSLERHARTCARLLMVRSSPDFGRVLVGCICC